MTGPISLRVDQIKKILDPENVAKAAFPTFYGNTPIGDPSKWQSKKAPPGYVPGNARRNTTVDKGEIVADYAYASRLDNGYSRQSPGGMTRPTLAFIRSYIRNNIGKK